MKQSISVYFLTLTDTNTSEHHYLSSLRDALLDNNIVEVGNWRNADVVHLFEVNFYTRAAIGEFRYAKLLRILRSDTPLVVSTDDLFFINEPNLTGRPSLYRLNHHTQRWLFSQSDGVIAISNSVRSALRKHNNEANIHTVYHGVEDAYRSESPPENPLFMLHVSLASKRKNPDALLTVAKRLDRRFVIAGSAWPDIVPDEPAYDNVETPGFVPESKLIDLYKRAGVFYFPTFHEGFSLPILEAMASSTAIVASDAYSVPEVTGEAALLHEPTDVTAHIDSIERLLTDDSRRQALAEKGDQRARGFTWTRAANETRAVYKDLLSTNSTA